MEREGRGESEKERGEAGDLILTNGLMAHTRRVFEEEVAIIALSSRRGLLTGQ